MAMKESAHLPHRLFFALTVILVLILTSCVTVNKAQAQDFASGTGIMDDPFIIDTANQLANLNNYLNQPDVYFKLGSDITSLPSPWTPIGPDFANTFASDFDGNGHTITGVVYSSQAYVGVFGVSAGSIENLTVDITLSSTAVDASAGALAGVAEGTIRNCYAAGNVTGTGDYSHVGGLVGLATGLIQHSYAAGNVTGTGDYSHVGGLVGLASGSIQESYATGSVTGVGNNDAVGGLAGFLTISTVQDCYAIGSVTGTETSDVTGGLVGLNFGGESSNCFFDSETAQPATTDSAGATPEPDAAMKNLFTYKGWDFNDVWTMPVLGYPAFAS
jgi:hypothetical protein